MELVETTLKSTTFDVILERMLGAVKKQNPNLDTREGSIIYNALAPAAVELQNLYIQLITVMNESFADTQSRYYLIKRAAERGVNVEPATKAIRKGVFDAEIPIGSRFSLNVLNYKAIEKISDYTYKMECETPGNAGNAESGKLIPIDYIEGLNSAELTDVLIPGEDEEETEHLRKRYYDSLDSQAFGGNIADYKHKVSALDGIGGVKVIPHWKGGGTVKLIIIDSDYNKPSSILVNQVQTAIDPVVNQGKGLGIAPIGHIVTVAPCDEVTVNISTHITFKEGYNFGALESTINKAMTDYLAELRALWADSDSIVVRISQIETRILKIDGVLDIEQTKINGSATNLILGKEKIPVKGALANV